MVADPADFFDLAPERVAVVLIDFQNDFCSPGVAASAQPTNTHNAAATTSQPRLPTPEPTSSTPARSSTLDRLTPRQRRWERPGGLCAAGSWGAELFLDPVPAAP